MGNLLGDLSGTSLIGVIYEDMPRKRRKAINTITTPDIPFQKVRVEWVDCVSDSAWANEKEFDKMKLAFQIGRASCRERV